MFVTRWCRSTHGLHEQTETGGAYSPLPSLFAHNYRPVTHPLLRCIQGINTYTPPANIFCSNSKRILKSLTHSLYLRFSFVWKIKKRSKKSLLTKQIKIILRSGATGTVIKIRVTEETWHVERGKNIVYDSYLKLSHVLIIQQIVIVSWYFFSRVPQLKDPIVYCADQWPRPEQPNIALIPTAAITSLKNLTIFLYRQTAKTQ